MDDDLVDNDLREERRDQTDELDGKRCQQYVAPDRLVLEELFGEPAETEVFLLGGEAGDGGIRI